jgi:uncharacterized protein YecT (DUF1311 family)
MSLLLALTLATTLATQAVADPPCPDGTTLDMNKCYEQRADRADASLARYVAAARARLKKEAAEASADDTSVATAAKGFDVAEAAWSKYRDAECGAVYDYWSSGTIRTVEGLDCRIKLTRLHTHTIWMLWLTYMDSTPPILPEPPLPAND